MGLLLYLEFFEDDIRRHDGGDGRPNGDGLDDSGTSDRVLPCQPCQQELRSLLYTGILFLPLSSEMFSRLIRRTSTTLHRSHPFIPRLPSSLSAVDFSLIFRAHSWSTQSQPANWSHLSDIYSRGVDMRPREPPMSPDARWAMQSHARMANLRPPKGPYAGKNIHPFPQTPRLSHISVQEGASK